jgi:hypothetical protein
MTIARGLRYTVFGWKLRWNTFDQWRTAVISPRIWIMRKWNRNTDGRSRAGGVNMVKNGLGYIEFGLLRGLIRVEVKIGVQRLRRGYPRKVVPDRDWRGDGRRPASVGIVR